ncbi:MAG TPA: LysR family transcriptional regulator [Xanthobacteraceae bacterium]|jgi:DNA-binding transcriptional LysR family regulator
MHHIRYFLAVSETLNLTKAAERCNVAQPALTRALKALESELGGELLRRERALSHLTELGQRMLPMLRQCYETARAAKMVAASIRKGGAAPLSIAVSHTVSFKRFTETLRELSRAFPGLQLKLYRSSGSEIVEFLKSGTAELAIAGPLDETWSRLDELTLFEEPFGLVVNRSHRLAGIDEAEFKDLASEKLLINTGCEMVEELKARLEANGILDTTHQVATREDVLALLKAGLGVAIIPVGAVEANGICRVPLKQLNLVRKVSLYTVAGRHRGIACATLFNMLRAADWGFATGKEQQRRAYR